MIDRLRNPSTLMCAGALTAPILTCVLLRLAAPAPRVPERPQADAVATGPFQESVASSDRDMPAPANLVDLLARAGELRAAGPASNPFYFPAEPVVSIEPAETPQRRPEPELPDLRLSGFLSGSSPMAIIEGRPRRTGDIVAPGWVLTSITPHERSVVLTGPGGHSLRLTVSD